MPTNIDYYGIATVLVDEYERHRSRRNISQLVDITSEVLRANIGPQQDEWITDRTPSLPPRPPLSDECISSRPVLFVEPDTHKVTIAVYKEKAGTPAGRRPMIWRTVERRVFRAGSATFRWRELPEYREEQNPIPGSFYWPTIPEPSNIPRTFYYTYEPPAWERAAADLNPTPEPEQPRTATGAMLSCTPPRSPDPYHFPALPAIDPPF